MKCKACPVHSHSRASKHAALCRSHRSWPVCWTGKPLVNFGLLATSRRARYRSTRPQPPPAADLVIAVVAVAARPAAAAGAQIAALGLLPSQMGEAHAGQPTTELTATVQTTGTGGPTNGAALRRRCQDRPHPGGPVMETCQLRPCAGAATTTTKTCQRRLARQLPWTTTCQCRPSAAAHRTATCQRRRPKASTCRARRHPGSLHAQTAKGTGSGHPMTRTRRASPRRSTRCAPLALWALCLPRTSLHPTPSAC